MSDNVASILGREEDVRVCLWYVSREQETRVAVVILPTSEVAS